LSKGIRATDISNLTEFQRNIIYDLTVNGRRTGYYFRQRGILDEIRALKTRAFIEGVRL